MERDPWGLGPIPPRPDWWIVVLVAAAVGALVCAAASIVGMVTGSG